MKLSHTFLQEEPEFKWSPVEKGLILSCFSWGYILSPVGGILASRFGGSVIFGIGLTVTALLTILSPMLVRISTSIFITGRILEGVSEVSAKHIKRPGSGNKFIYLYDHGRVLPCLVSLKSIFTGCHWTNVPFWSLLFLWDLQFLQQSHIPFAVLLYKIMDGKLYFL